MSVIIPCRLEPCEIPRTLKPFKVLDIYNNRKLWWNRMVDAIELDSDYVIKKQSDSKKKSASDLELIGANFLGKLQRAKMEEVVHFLAKPIAYDLFHFLNQCNIMYTNVEQIYRNELLYLVHFFFPVLSRWSTRNI